MADGMNRVTNPVLAGFHPDPSILRVGEWFYIANSTFEWYPGVELHRSRDLANWESLPSPLSEKRLLDMEGERSSCGIWAPCLSYSDNLFWLIYTNVRSWNAGPWKDCPNFLTTAPSIEGPWSDQVFLTCSGFDPSLFHDDDGKKWLVSMEWDYRQKTVPEGYQFTGILLQEYSPAEKKLVGAVRKIFKGTSIMCVEGPHLYKRNGWYYLLTAEGGTCYGHAATLARSRSIEGPYEVHPSNPLISSRDKPEQYLQKAGHASWCETPDGRYYLAYLCGRPLPGTKHCVLGRETSISEMVWHDDWPYIKGEEGTRQNHPTNTFETPVNLNEPVSADKSKIYTFNSPAIHSDFKTLRTPMDPHSFSLGSRPGYLRLRGGQSPISAYGQTLLARRQQDFSFTAETCLEFSPQSFQELAGLCWRYDERNQYLFALTHNESRNENKGRVLSILSMTAGQFLHEEGPTVPEGPLYLRLTVREQQGSFSYSTDGKTYTNAGSALDSTVLSDEFDFLGFTGAFIGMFCVDTAMYKAVADFKYFSYTPE